MSHKYQKTYSIPKNFQKCLKDFTREVLRQQPSNIYEFGYNYFIQKVESEKQKGIEIETEEQDLVKFIEPQFVQEQLIKAFGEADKDKSGYIYIGFVKDIIKTAIPRVTDLQILYIITFAGMNDKGLINYNDLITKAAPTIALMITKNSFAQDYKAEDVDTVHSLNKEELEEEMRALLQRADSSRTGKLPMEQFKKELEEAELDLSKKEITAILSETPIDDEGNVEYESIIPKMHNLLYHVQQFEDIEI